MVLAPFLVMDGGREPGKDGANDGEGSDLGTWVQGLLEFKDTHRHWEGPVPLDITLL